jgi:biopolymer transport protein ExbD
MAMAAGTAEGEPMMDINTTPLIDVMLVLLIMFIITIPIQTHAVKLDLPQDTGAPPPLIEPVKNKVSITPDNQVTWNGQPIDIIRLRQYLDITQTMNPIPELHLEPDPQARYSLVDQVLGVTKRAKVEKMGFVGNERYAQAF